MNAAMKSYLNPNDRFAARMKASLSKERDGVKVADNNDQETLFVDNRNVKLNGTDLETAD